MTTLIAARDKAGNLALGTDSGIFRSYLIDDMGPKWLDLGDWTVMFSGSLFHPEYLRDLYDETDGASDPARHGLFSSEEPGKAARRFAREVWSRSKADGHTEKSGATTSASVHLIAAHRPSRRVFMFGGDGGTFEMVGDYVCAGAGEDVASGAMAALTRHTSANADTMVERALRITIDIHAFTGGKPHVRMIRATDDG